MSRSLGVILLVSLVGCAPRLESRQAGVAPDGVYAFAGTVQGEVVSGTLEFGDPVIVSSSHGACERLIRGMYRWGGGFSVTCPGVAVQVVVAPDGGLRRYGYARIRKVAYREVRTTCRTWQKDPRTCLAWNTALEEYDRWVRGRVEVKSLDS